MKIIKLLTLVLFLFLPSIILSQNKMIDSLKQELKLHPEKDSTRVHTLNRLAFSYYRTDSNKSIKYIEEAEIISDSIDFKKGKGKAVFIRGVIQMTLSNFDKAIEYYQQSEQLYSDVDYKIGVSNCYSGKGNVYNYQGDYEKALLNYNKALQIEKEIGVTKNIPHHLYNIGLVHYYTGKYEEALSSFNKVFEIYSEKNDEFRILKTLNVIALVYQQQGNYPYALKKHYKSLEIAKKLKDSSNISNSLNNIGTIYEKQENYEKSLEFLEKALTIKINKNDKKGIAATKNNIGSVYIKKEDSHNAIKNLNDALEINRSISALDQIAISLNKLGDANVALKKYIIANNYYEEAKNINIEIENQEGLSYSYLGIANSHFEQKSYNKALPNVLKSLEISKKLNLLGFERDAQNILSEIYENNGDYNKALQSHQQFKRLNDSLFNKENIEKIAQLEYEYKYKQALDSASIRELQLTQTVKTTSQDLEKSQRNLLQGVIAFLLIALVLGSIIFFLKLRNEKSKMQNIVIEQKLLRSQMTPHFIFNSLSVLQGMILNKEEKKSVSYLSKFSKLLRTTLESSRHKLVPISEELSALESYMALQNLDVNPPFNYTVSVASEIDQTSLNIPPMLIQPFIENVIEHAFPNKKENKEISVTILLKEEKLVCSIIDNGIGIDVGLQKSKKNKKSLATTITSERLIMLSKDFKMKGSISIEDRQKYKKQGTIVTLVIPYKID